MRKIIIILAILLTTTQSNAQREVDAYAGMRMNQLQYIGSHNSYKPGIEPALWKLIYQKDSLSAKALQYGHNTLTQQLDLGLRSLELDVVHDPAGGRYQHPKGLDLLAQYGKEAQPFDISGDLAKPGLKVFHIPDIDFRSHHLLFIDCLKELKTWSDKHPGHLPVIITINAKDGNEKDLTPLLPFTSNALDSIDQEIKTVFGNSRLITPDFVRGNFRTLEEAILKTGWPSLSKVAGRFLFVLDETGRKLEDYKEGHPALSGRVLFVNEEAGSPEAAFMIKNNPIQDSKLIRSMVQKGYLVRTRADANTIQARTEDYQMFNAALNTGAQIITTDYYIPSAYFKSAYRVVFDNNQFVRENLVTHHKQ